MDNGCVVSIYDEEAEYLVMCCTLCGAAEIIDMAPYADETEVDIPFEHDEGCPCIEGASDNSMN